MRVSRELNVAINWVLNELLPPVIRDCPWFFLPLFHLMFGKKKGLFFHFHERINTMSDAEFAQLNQDIQSVLIERPTDLNDACLKKILREVQGKNVLEAGCGRGYLSRLLGEANDVTAVDIALPADMPQHPRVRYMQSNLEHLPFADKQFDVVICTHTLEHVRNIQTTLRELRRVCAGRLIIVVPCERPYFYTFNLHIHFFPYAFSLLAMTGTPPGHSLEKLNGDWYYEERLNAC